MSWPESLRKLVFVGAALTCAALTAGCEIRPLYAGAGSGLESELQAITIDPIPDRLGHYVANELIFAFNGTGSQVTPKYRLTVILRERVSTPLIDTFTSRATAGTVIIDVTYTLTPVGGGAAILSASANNLATYDRSQQRFANVRAARDAEIRDAKAIADQIRLRVSAALAAKAG